MPELTNPIVIALAGNPNSGKTTLFNRLTGLNQFVGNWPGVTVEKKEGRLKGGANSGNRATVIDLPGIYSLSPYSPEEKVAREYLLDRSDGPDVVIDVVDGTNIERNLYLATQLLEVGTPLVIALNMIDAVEKSGDEIDAEKLSRRLGCPVIKMSAIDGTGVSEAVDAAIDLAGKHVSGGGKQLRFSGEVEQALSSLSALLPSGVEPKRFFSIKLFERDPLTAEFDGAIRAKAEEFITPVEAEEKFGDDAESIITSERYAVVSDIVRECVKKKSDSRMSTSDKIDLFVTDRRLALPLFAAVMFMVYYVSVTTVGAWATDWANDGLFGEGWEMFGLSIPGIPVIAARFLEWAGTAEWLNALIIDGIIAGVGAVLGFVPQMLVLFVFLAILEDCGYMARIAFILDRVFRGFGLSGKSFIPILIGTGCGVPGLMASRAIENDRDRKMTLITTTFIPCSAKIPVIGLISIAVFNGTWWVAPSAYFAGLVAILASGIILKKTSIFAGDPAPFVMELPPYRMPTVVGVCHGAWERAKAFIVKAGTIILLSVIAVWFLSSFGVADGGIAMVEDINDSILAAVGRFVAVLFVPLGFGDWRAAVASITGIIAKENVVGTLAILYDFSAEAVEEGAVGASWGGFAAAFGPVVAYSFLMFNLLCSPCCAAIGTIWREMNNKAWTLFALAWQTGVAWLVALCVYHYGLLFTEGVFGPGTAVAIAVTALFLFLLFRPAKEVA
ncbi:MAG: ferrous iron transport protein B [Synergistaceae bacterium]|jgi:ferrous iron transport protein B|nr:ferrous iron transport protein B [Synergistaceae bacterium]